MADSDPHMTMEEGVTRLGYATFMDEDTHEARLRLTKKDGVFTITVWCANPEFTFEKTYGEGAKASMQSSWDFGKLCHWFAAYRVSAAIYNIKTNKKFKK